MRRIILFIILLFCFNLTSYGAPCDGTTMPKKKEFFSGIQTHNIFKRYLEDEFGELRSLQHFLLVSYGVADWLSIDLKGGAGYLKQHPRGSDEVDYPSAFSGGYGLRLKLYEQDKKRLTFGFQHISVHPKKVHLEEGKKNTAVLDEWQVSLLASYDFLKFSPYVGTKWSRIDYIHWVEENRKRRMSDLTKSFGLVLGSDFFFNEKFWFNLEGQFFDGEALAFGINFKF